MKNSELRVRARNLAVRIIETCDNVDVRKGRKVLIDQIVRSATSVGANLCEANYGASKADFINKMQIALKECYETEYWIDIMFSVDCFNESCAKSLLSECGVIRRMLVKAINTAKDSL